MSGVALSVFFDADNDALFKILKFEKKKDRACDFKFLKMHGKSKNQNVKIISNGCLLYSYVK